MAENAAIWKLHLIYRLSHIPERFDADVRGKVRALEGVSEVDVAPSHDASTRLTFSTPYAHAVIAAVAANTVSPRDNRRPQCHRVVVAAESAAH